MVSMEPSRPPRLSRKCTSVASRVHGTTGEPCSSAPWWLRMMCSSCSASTGGEPRVSPHRREAVDLLAQPAHAVVAERDLALQAPRAREIDGRSGDIRVQLADVVQ